MARRKRVPWPPGKHGKKTYSHAECLRILMLGGARGGYGFGRYPEGIFGTPRDMVFVYARKVG